MKYCVVGKGHKENEMADKLVTTVLTEYSRELYGFTRKEFDSIVEYDFINIMAFLYSKMNVEQKRNICDFIAKKNELTDMYDSLDNLAMFMDNDIYVPLSCKLMDRLGDNRYITIVYETLFLRCKELAVDEWNHNDSYSNYLALLTAAFFEGLAYKLHVKRSFAECINAFYSCSDCDEIIEQLYELHIDDFGWDADVELDVLERLISDSKEYSSFDESETEEFFDAVDRMDSIRRKHFSAVVDEDEVEGFSLIIKKTGIREINCKDIKGFTCHYCEAKNGNDEYILIYQKETRINEIIDDEEAWADFQKEVYREDIRLNRNASMVYIVYILDDDSNNIPIQIIESNKTYGRKYVFTEEETITFINGIVKTSNTEISAASPVQEWDRILREEHLTGCLTEAYSAKKVESYLSGKRFDADYIQDDDYSSMKGTAVPQVKWVKSLDTTGFRDFCFDDKIMDFGQINLFYGANGSGKTSVLEAIEYALTSEVRRVKDFKVKLPTESYPRLSVYDTEAGVHVFTPGFSKKNNKEIERVWYGVPVGRTKSNLNENFNRFNAFDSEAAYKFIHESDNSEDTYASMFGNLMFGESVVDHEKKWQRFKKAFNEKYSELRSKLNSARFDVQYYEDSLAQKSRESRSELIEKGIEELKLLNIKELPKYSSYRYPKLLEELSAVRKYVLRLSSANVDKKTIGNLASDVAEIKSKNLQYIKEKRSRQETITKLVDENGIIKKKIFEEKETANAIQERIEQINTNIRNWTIVQNVLSHEDTIKLANDLVQELSDVDRDLFYISKLEQRPTVIKFLKMDNHDTLSLNEREYCDNLLCEKREEKKKIENMYADAKKAFGEKEQQLIELRKIGKTLVVDAVCPLCGQEYDNADQVIKLIENAVIVDDNIENLILELQEKSKRIIELEAIIDRDDIIKKAKNELAQLSDDVPMVSICGTSYSRLYDYYISKSMKEKRKEEIIEQQATLDAQGFSLKNISACKEYTLVSPAYLEYKNNGSGTYENYLQEKMNHEQLALANVNRSINRFENQIRQNEQQEELLKTEIHKYDALLEALDMDSNREIEQALANIKGRFEVAHEKIICKWIDSFNSLFDQCELEVERIESQSSIALEKQWLEEAKETVKNVTPQVERCARAVQVFEQMPSLSSFVEKGIKNNIQQISKFFKWMHHSGEFEELGIDEDGIFAIRGMNHQKIRTYEMSTGQRATIAMAVMFALHLAAPDAPQFLLLDEPLATMDDTQVLNVLDILKSMAEQNTQIFFTTANGIMINLFKECFKNTDFDYKEYQFIKRVNRPSEIKETNINDAKTIEEITLDDLTLDFNQFAQIRDILRRNQEKLVNKDEWEDLNPNKPLEKANKGSDSLEVAGSEDDFLTLLLDEERELLAILVHDDGMNATTLMKSLSKYPTYKLMFEKINEKAIDFFGETIVENDDELPWMEEDYIEELKAMGI